jgi:hypothetical protein
MNQDPIETNGKRRHSLQDHFRKALSGRKLAKTEERGNMSKLKLIICTLTLLGASTFTQVAATSKDIPSNSAPGEDLTAKTFDGYFFEQMMSKRPTQQVMRAFFIGFLKGYSYGYMTGQQLGSVKALTIYKKSEKEIGKISDEKEKRVMEMTIQKIRKNLPDPNTMFKEDYDFYFGELVSFYKTYPLCKSHRLDTLLFELVQYWSGKSDKKNYQEIGESCLSLGKGKLGK